MRSSKSVGGALPTVRPERVGLSGERLTRIGDWLEGWAESGRAPGAVVMVARRGKVAYCGAFGKRDGMQPAGPGNAMPQDALFRIQSMTKPILSVALMQLHEQGRLTLDEPIVKYLPALGNMQVAALREGASDGSYDLVRAERPITIHDLMRQTAGFTYGIISTHVQSIYQELDARRLDLDNEGLVTALVQLPLASQPGSRWQYGYASEVVGRLIEVLSGRTLGQYFTEHIFKPLGMTDTGFWLRPDQLPRAAEPGAHPDTGAPQPVQDHRTPRRLERGGGGLVSTPRDYLRFAQMLLNGGELDGARLIGPRTLAWMTADHLGSRPGPDAFIGPGYGFGLGFAVRRGAGGAWFPGSAGDYYWWGYGGTVFWVDPAEELVAVGMMQSIALRYEFQHRLRALVYQAIVD